VAISHIISHGTVVPATAQRSSSTSNRRGSAACGTTLDVRSGRQELKRQIHTTRFSTNENEANRSGGGRLRITSRDGLGVPAVGVGGWLARPIFSDWHGRHSNPVPFFRWVDDPSAARAAVDILIAHLKQRPDTIDRGMEEF